MQDNHRKAFVNAEPFSREYVKIDGTLYLLDMRHTLEYGNECMAFECNGLGKVKSVMDVWAKRGIALTKNEFEKCKREFMEDMRRRNHVQN